MSTPSPATRDYIVTGMTCEHCVRSVTEEVSELDGVTTVEVALADGVLRVTGANLDDGAVTAAVAEAGYEARPR